MLGAKLSKHHKETTPALIRKLKKSQEPNGSASNDYLGNGCAPGTALSWHGSKLCHGRCCKSLQPRDNPSTASSVIRREDEAEGVCSRWTALAQGDQGVSALLSVSSIVRRAEKSSQG